LASEVEVNETLFTFTSQQYKAWERTNTTPNNGEESYDYSNK